VDGKDFSLAPHFTQKLERCRPPKLIFKLPTENAGKVETREQVFHPRNGARYVVRQDDSGRVTVEVTEKSGERGA
jgi:hypothetical protein